MSNRKEEALRIFNEGFSCAQAVFTVFAQDEDIDAETALRIAGGFGAGVCSGEICGAASGGVMALGTRFGQHIPGDNGAKMNCRAKTTEFLDKFRRISGGNLRCHDILGYEYNSDEGQARFIESGDRARVCAKLVGDAVDILEKMLGEA